MTLWDSIEPTAAQERQATTWTVTDLGAAISASLKSSFPQEIWVRGEIRSSRPPNRNGHQYFDLVDPGDNPGDAPHAKLSVTLFSGRRRSVIEQLAEAGSDTSLSDGIEVRIRGALDWWTAGGKLNFIMSGIDPVFTLGQLDAQRRALLQALTSEGLIDRNARIPVPVLPLRIGLVTSAGSAAHADFLNELAGSRYAFDVVLADARVQGTEAPASVSAAITKLVAAAPDLIAVVRGGGSRTDLVAFDHGDVARAIATSPIPVFTGIGHEIDRSVADEVANRAFKTPTAVAAGIVTIVAVAEDALDAACLRLRNDALRRFDAAARRLDDRGVRLARAARAADARATAHLVGFEHRLIVAAQHRLGAGRQHLERDVDRLSSIAPLRLDRHRERLESAAARISAYDPAKVLARGWSMTRTSTGALVRSIDDLAPGDQLITTVADGTLTSTITDLSTKE